MSYSKVDNYNEEITGKLMTSYRDVLGALGEDPDREGLLKTPERLAKAMQFLTQGYHLDAKAIINSAKFHEDAVLNGEADMGVIIHENRFTYQQRGLHKVMDLGEYWEKQTGVPIPLGGIAAKRDLPEGVAVKVASLIRESLQYSFDRYPDVSPYVKAHAQAMEEQVMRQHIDLYVNNYSLDLGTDGRNAIDTLHRVFLQREGQPRPAEGLFI